MRRVVVDFCDPNATKALHVGHLRNVAVGHALASMLEAAGAEVVRQSHIGDAGRSMGEAMAGWELHGAEVQIDRLKSDHEIGECYARYAREVLPARGLRTGDAPVARELARYDDRAQDLLDRIDRGDTVTMMLREQVRLMVLHGQQRTLDRLGVRFDRLLLDSDRSVLARDVARVGVERGVFVLEAGGTIAYMTGDESYPVMPLTRADGAPTHHLRAIAMWRDAMLAADAADLIHVSGDEWGPHVRHVEEILAKLEPGVPVLPSAHVLHGMVVNTGGGKLSSSSGEAPLIDDVLDGLTPLVHHEAQPILLLGYCLGRITTRKLAFDADQLLDDRNAGWRLARAWARAQHHPEAGAIDPFHQQALADAVEHLDPHRYLRWLLAYIDLPVSPKMKHATIQAGLSALGLLPRPRSTT